MEIFLFILLVGLLILLYYTSSKYQKDNEIKEENVDETHTYDIDWENEPIRSTIKWDNEEPLDINTIPNEFKDDFEEPIKPRVKIKPIKKKEAEILAELMGEKISPIYERVMDIENSITDISDKITFMETRIPTAFLSIDDIDKVIDKVFTEVWDCKYKLYFVLREVTIIHKMDEEIANLTKDVVNAFSPDFMKNVRRFYNEEYIISSITRRAQISMVEYTKQYGPIGQSQQSTLKK